MPFESPSVGCFVVHCALHLVGKRKEPLEQRPVVWYEIKCSALAD